MNITKSTYELLQPVIDAIDKTFTIDSIVDNTGSYTLFACNTLWATAGYNITIDSIVYKITAINPNVNITITGASLPTADSFQLYVPIFYHGTFKATEGELSKKKNNRLSALDKLPMIWLHEPVDETRSEDPTEAIALTSRCELFFMTESNFAKWSNDDHYSYAIKPMRNLINSFMNAVKYSGTINDNDILVSHPKDLPRFGKYTATDNNEKTMFSEYTMSGCRFDVELPFIRSNKTCCI